jgi:nucleoside-diphosphate-sugar epimerase
MAQVAQMSFERRVLVTGASGFIGRHVLGPLLDRGFEVHAVARSPLEGPPGVAWHRADLLEPAGPKTVVRDVRPTHLLHLAWCAVPGEFWTSPENLLWLARSLELALAFAAHGGRRLVVAGTCAEYDWADGHCVEDATPLAPSTIYGAAKRALHAVLEPFAAGAALSVAWGRIFHLYGPGEHPNRLVASVVRALLRDQPALCTDGTQVRDFLYVKDVADAFAALLDSAVTGPVNIASGEPVAVRDVIERIGSLAGRPELIKLGARAAPPEPPRITAAVRRLREELGWRPRYDLTRGLGETLAWWEAQLKQPAAQPQRNQEE